MLRQKKLKLNTRTKILEARKSAQLEITQCQKSYKELFDIELNKVRYDVVLADYDNILANEKASALKTLETEIESISEQILGKIYV